MIEIKKPRIECIETPADSSYGKYIIEPLERGYGTTLGNSLRRVLLSSLPGIACTSIKIAGVQHEFSTIPGVKEDVTEIVLNVKSIIARLHSTGPKTVYLEASGEGLVTAGDIKPDAEVEILNPEQPIATLGPDGALSMELVLDHGRLVFDGDVEEAIAIYSQIQKKDKSPYMNLIDAPRYRSVEKGRFVTFESIEFLNKEENLFKKGEIATVKVILSSEKKLTDAKIRFGYYDTYGRKIASGICTDIGTVEKGENEINMDVDFTGLVAGTYRGELILFTLDKIRGVIEHDIVLEGFWFDVDYESEFRWNSFKWGAVRLHDMIKK